MSPFDPRALGAVRGVSLTAVAYRNQARGFDLRSSDGARRLGGRFNPPHSFPELCLCLTKPCIVAELTKQAERQSLNLADLLPRELWQMDADLERPRPHHPGGTHRTRAGRRRSRSGGPSVHARDRGSGPRARVPSHPIQLGNRVLTRWSRSSRRGLLGRSSKRTSWASGTCPTTFSIEH